jgi:hypothetical protein
MNGRRRLPALVAILLLCGAAIFVVGTRIERRTEHVERVASPSEAPGHVEQTPASVPPSPTARSSVHNESGESGHTETTAAPTLAKVTSRLPSAVTPEPEAAGETGHQAATESFLGINPDSTPAVASAVVVSVSLAALVFAFPNALILLIAALAGIGFTALDAREILHQVSRSRGSLVATASAVAVLHLAAAITAFVASRRVARRVSV